MADTIAPAFAPTRYGEFLRGDAEDRAMDAEDRDLEAARAAEKPRQPREPDPLPMP